MENILTDTIGIVEDQPTVREALAAELARSARQVLVWACAEEAVRSPQLSSLTFLCLDLGLPHMSGVDFIRWLRQNVYKKISDRSYDREAGVNPPIPGKGLEICLTGRFPAISVLAWFPSLIRLKCAGTCDFYPARPIGNW
ncbi:MAG: response regulator [Spirochaetales bacterium]|nr:response regulator [Spirochaetales bacterium]